MNRRALLQSLGVGMWAAAGWPLAYADAAADFQTVIIRDNFVQMRKLLQQGMDPNTADERGRPALVKTMQLESLRVAQELIKAPGIHINAVSTAGETALMHACIKGHIDVVRQLLALGARVNQPGWTPLHYAASADTEHSTEIARLLLDAGADVQARNQLGLSAVDFARRSDRAFMVKILEDAYQATRRSKASW